MAYQYEVEVIGVEGYHYTAPVKGTRAATQSEALDALIAYCNSLAASGQNKAGARICRNAKCVEVI